MALAMQLLERYGVLTREAVHAEEIPGGFAAVYEILKTLEDRGRVRRGYFVAGLGATQFALPGADERLRAVRHTTEESRTVILAATDPANPYGATLPWPEIHRPFAPGSDCQRVEAHAANTEMDQSTPTSNAADSPGARAQRAAGAQVVLHHGALIGWIPRTERNLLTFLPEAEPERTQAATALAGALSRLVETGRRRAVLVSTVNGKPVSESFLSRFLIAAGFTPGSRGHLKRTNRAGLWGQDY